MYFHRLSNKYINMELIKLTENNVKNYIGFDIIFNSRGIKKLKNILNVSQSGKTIIIDEPDLNNTLQIVTRNVYVIIS